MNILKINNAFRWLALMAASLCFFPAGAQLHEQISVEGKYVPDVIRIDRINVFPKAFRMSMGASPLAYDLGGVAAAFRPSPLAMPATPWDASRRISDNPGYLDLGLGSWLNSTLSAGYRIVDTEETLIGLRLQHNSTSLFKPYPEIDVKQFRYDESLGLYASQVMDGYGRLDAALDYHFGRFNYAGAARPNRTEVPDQTLNDVALRLDWHSPSTPGNDMTWHATGLIRHFGYRSLWLPGVYLDRRFKGSRETDIGLEGGLRMPWDNGSSIGLDAKLDIMALGGGFGSGESTEENPWEGRDSYDGVIPAAKDYGVMTLTPYYRFNRGLLDARVGADIDMAFNAGPKGDRYPFLHVAPDMKFAMQTGQVGLFVNLTGGTELNTLSRLHELDYYSLPALLTTRPSFTPLDAAFGLNLGPFSGFSLGAEVRFKSTKNVPLDNSYMSWLFGRMVSIPGGGDGIYYGIPDLDGLNIHGVSFSGNLAYRYGSVFSLKVAGTVQQQNGETGFFNGYDRPKVTADVNIGVSPVERLRLDAGFNWRWKRAVYSASTTDIVSGEGVIQMPERIISRRALPDFTDLSFGVSWSFTPDFSVWGQAGNILNRKNIILPDQPSQGVNFTAGLSVRF